MQINSGYLNFQSLNFLNWSSLYCTVLNKQYKFFFLKIKLIQQLFNNMGHVVKKSRKPIYNTFYMLYNYPRRTKLKIDYQIQTSQIFCFFFKNYLIINFYIFVYSTSKINVYKMLWQYQSRVSKFVINF